MQLDILIFIHHTANFICINPTIYTDIHAVPHDVRLIIRGARLLSSARSTLIALVLVSPSRIAQLCLLLKNHKTFQQIIVPSRSTIYRRSRSNLTLTYKVGLDERCGEGRSWDVRSRGADSSSIAAHCLLVLTEHRADLRVVLKIGVKVRHSSQTLYGHERTDEWWTKSDDESR